MNAFVAAGIGFIVGSLFTLYHVSWSVKVGKGRYSRRRKG